MITAPLLLVGGLATGWLINPPYDFLKLMTDHETKLLPILRVAHEASLREAGISLRAALIRTGYRGLRPRFGPADLLPIIESQRTLVNQWIAYSKDKRTSGGWYLLESGEIGRVGAPESRMLFDALEEAVAHYIVRELDFWSGLAD